MVFIASLADMAQKPKKEIVQELELVPDAWPRFERFIKHIAKAGPQHKTSEMKVAKKPSKKKTTVPKTKAR
jgi:predicted transposase YdaD